jgi:hypothetical protein
VEEGEEGSILRFWQRRRRQQQQYPYYRERRKRNIICSTCLLGLREQAGTRERRRRERGRSARERKAVACGRQKPRFSEFRSLHAGRRTASKYAVVVVVGRTVVNVKWSYWKGGGDKKQRRELGVRFLCRRGPPSCGAHQSLFPPTPGGGGTRRTRWRRHPSRRSIVHMAAAHFPLAMCSRRACARATTARWHRLWTLYDGGQSKSYRGGADPHCPAVVAKKSVVVGPAVRLDVGCQRKSECHSALIVQNQLSLGRLAKLKVSIKPRRLYISRRDLGGQESMFIKSTLATTFFFLSVEFRAPAGLFCTLRRNALIRSDCVGPLFGAGHTRREKTRHL